ncbi:MAG TPA: VWA domain-containing protein [Planctomycetota bacterium]|nr:VWA domain-containing protein [Planctomycetota bacterium]
MRSFVLVAVVLALVCQDSLFAAQAQLNVAIGQPTLIADKKQTAFVKVALTGFAIENPAERTPVNVALVLDRSGSMQGPKLEHAKIGAISALERLGPNDIVSVIVFDDTVNVLVPATKLTDKASVRAAIERIQAGGSTALFAGVSKGAEEVRKFIDRNRVNRVILLTDGIANVGPSSTAELGSLGASLKKEGIAVSTLGLGDDYNEDLLYALAARSDGNHAFIKKPGDLARIFNCEFGEVLTVVGQEVSVKIQCAEGIRPVRALGREADISGQTVYAQLNQLYANQEKYIMLEVEIPATENGKTREIATVNVSYSNTVTKTTDKLSSTVSASFSNVASAVDRDEIKKVMVDAVLLVGTDNNSRAMVLRDQGNIKAAKEVFLDNNVYLSGNASRYKSKDLENYWNFNNGNLKGIEDNDEWNKTRKDIQDEGFKHRQQRGF